MNKLKILTIVIIFLGTASCNESFLEEKLTTQISTEYFNTPEGLKSLALSLPQVFRVVWSHQFSMVHTQSGTDEFAAGSDVSNAPWNNYSAVLQSFMQAPNLVTPQTAWDICYVAISSQNTVIDKAPDILAGDAELDAVLGSAYFFRGWTYLYLVQQWGGVPLKLKPSESLEREFTRASRQEVVQQVIDDFQKAYDLLNNPANDQRVPGKIYKTAAAHFLARALLFRQSEICGDFNAATKTDDLDKALSLCDEVIAGHLLAPNFVELWDFTGADGPNEQLSEIIAAAQYTVSTANANGRYLNTHCLNFVSVYQNWTGMERDIAGGREWAQLRTSNYAMDVYDRVKDSRFWKSFRTTQRLNYPSDRNGADFEKLNLQIGQLGVTFIINNEDDADRFIAHTGNPVMLPGSTNGTQPPLVSIYDAATDTWDTVRCPVTGNVVPNVIPRYRKVKNEPSADSYGYRIGSNTSTWPSLSKHLDGTRPDYNSSDGARDGIIARVAETYLMAAEIRVRQSDYTDALRYINPVRNRAAYKAGENREKYADGSQTYTNTTDPRRSTSFWNKNTYYISNNISVTTDATNIAVNDWHTLPPEDEAIIAKLQYTSDFDRMLCFVLNERSRELAGEMHRWADLSRTKTLVKRTLAYNEDAAIEAVNGKGLNEYHLVRPIPQSFLDQIWKDGHALTADEKQALQNPGYN
ncbi:MAG: RagB/SusD family nutrient uptake outer membrane protein [Tannerella sp.]|jgi:hypothetical protein|nr:RagB/SusD family nutrient uptake outer membrane protein [Tannerella sp.]